MLLTLLQANCLSSQNLSSREHNLGSTAYGYGSWGKSLGRLSLSCCAGVLSIYSVYALEEGNSSCLSMDDTLGIYMHRPSLTYNAPLINLVTCSFTTQLLASGRSVCMDLHLSLTLKLQPHF